MKYIYGIRDRIANELIGNSMYLLFVFRTDQQAVRYFADAIMDEKSILAKHPNDYELVQLGHLEESLGGEIIISTEKHTIIITGNALIAATTEHQPRLVQENA